MKLSVGYKRKFFQLEPAKGRNSRAEPSTSKILDLFSEPSRACSETPMSNTLTVYPEKIYPQTIHPGTVFPKTVYPQGQFILK